MTYTTKLAATLIGLMVATACGDDTTSTGGGGAGEGGDGGQGGSATGAGGSATGSGMGGDGVGGGGQTGCATDPTICTGGLVCCSGVPYPAEGICQAECNMASDRAIKHDIRPVDGDRVLEQLAELEVSRWRYDAAPAREHIGPMAQDFRAAFGLGGDGRSIAAVDANGVTMAAIQALHDRVIALEAQAAERARDNRALRDEVARLSALGRACPQKAK